MKKVMRFWSPILLATAASSTLAQDSGAVTSRPIHIVVQDYSGGTLATLRPSGDTKYLRKLSEDFDGLQAALPNVDIRALIHENFCRELTRAPADRCDQVTVADQRDAPRSVTVSADAPSPLLVMLSLEYAVDPVYPDALQVIATYGIHGAHADLRPKSPKQSADPILQVLYSTGAPAEIGGSPIRISKKPSKKELEKHAAARAYWLEGTPSRLENEIRRALSDVAIIGREVLPHITPEAPKDSYFKWLSEVPKASSLRDSGKLTCQKTGCNEHILRLDETRQWRLATQQLPLFVVSAPLPRPH